MIDMKVAYIDCFSGISGDMFLGAILDAGFPFERLKGMVMELPLDGFDIRVKKEKRHGIQGSRLMVVVDNSAQKERSFKQIIEIIDRSKLHENVKEKCKDVFFILARAEGKIHGCEPENIHFHEIGAVDSIVDIVGSVYAIEDMGINKIYCSSIPLGGGFVSSRHGRLPVPAPATLEILKGIPVYGTGIMSELVTPTGGALLRGLVHEFGSMPPMSIDSVGYGVGARELPERPNLLRLFIGRQTQEKSIETILTLETNLDDVQAEWMGFLMERLFQAGALDVIFFPVHMKKNRPGVMLQVMANPQDKDKLMDLIFNETTTLGIRFNYLIRKVLPRTVEQISSPWGLIKVKRVQRPDGSSWIVPEYDECRRIAVKKGIPLREIYSWISSLNRTQVIQKE
jgi:hypothetical protein